MNNEPLAETIDALLWFYDQLSVDVLTESPERALIHWRNERSGIASLIERSHRESLLRRDFRWKRVAGALATLIEAIDLAVEARLSPTVDPRTVHDGIIGVNHYRAVLNRELFNLNR